MIKAKVYVETAKAVYKPGDVIKEQLSDADMAFLKKHNFIATEADDFPVADDAEDDSKADSGDLAMGGGITPPVADNDSGGVAYKDEAALKKLNKDEIVGYAASIGLKLDEAALKADMIDAVLNFIEEKAAE